MSKLPPNSNRAEINVAARRVLLDALEALREHKDAITIVGAQAVAMQTSHADLAEPSYTSDADFGIDPDALEDTPRLETAMKTAGFLLGENPGSWLQPISLNGQIVNVVVDLMIGDSFSGGTSKRRGIIPPHSDRATRRTIGLEPSAIDFDIIDIHSYDNSDPRIIGARVAGPAALLVAKSHKLHDRAESGGDRLNAKDAGDIIRLMMAVDIATAVERMNTLLANTRSSESTRLGLRYLTERFGRSGAIGNVLATEALLGVVSREQIIRLAPAYVVELGSRIEGAPNA